jgi:hypothetical protein
MRSLTQIVAQRTRVIASPLTRDEGLKTDRHQLITCLAETGAAERSKIADHNAGKLRFKMMLPGGFRHAIVNNVYKMVQRARTLAIARPQNGQTATLKVTIVMLCFCRSAVTWV